MSACPQCGTLAARPTDNFCNVCGTALARRSSGPNAPVAPAPPPAHAAPAVPQYAPQQGPYLPTPLPPGFGLDLPLPIGRCPMGHEVGPGSSYCGQGHPIALDPTQMSAEAFGALPPHAGYGAPPQPLAGYGAPPQPLAGYGAPPAPMAYPPQPAPSPYGPPPAQPPGPLPGPRAQYPAAASPPAIAREAPPKMLRGFLVAYGANPSGEFWPLTGGRLTIGRLGSVEGLDIPLADPTISSRHAAMIVDAASGSVTIEDTSSTNGTFVNDEHIGVNGRRELHDGDRVRFGGFITTVKIMGRV